MRRTKVAVNGEMVEAEEVDFTPLKEEWNVYECEDGTRVKVRFIVQRVTRLLDKRMPNGEPMYLVEWAQPAINTQVQPHLMMEGR
jgi:hypothetical protein